MNKIFMVLSIVCCLSAGSGYTLTASPLVRNGKPDTTYIRYPEGRAFVIPQKHAYHKTLVMKILMAHALYDGKLKRSDNGKSKVHLTYDQALDVIRRIDNLTLGIPKIVYIVGWQYNGHDSKYPAWFEGNEKLKRPGDANSLESLKWLMKEATRYNTTISLHINMFDAYEDSPLWDTYVKNDIIAKNADGTLRPCEWGWPISYAQEWKTGYAQKRIDSLCNMLPIQKAGTIHIDAFHSWPPVPVVDASGKSKIDLTKGPISPYLKYTIQDETEAQRKIFSYWGSKGIDVTSEGVDFLRETAFDGYQAMAWWFGGLGNYLKYPASYYCGGQDNSDWGKLFGNCMHGEDIIGKDFLNLPGFKEQFCLRTVIWLYLNSLDRLYVINNPDYKAVQFSDNVRSSLTNDQYRIAKGDVTLVENGDILVPALWLSDNSLIAYSRNGYQNKTWELPKEWAKVKSVRMSRISMGGKSQVEVRNAGKGALTLSLKKDEMVIIEKL